jgi:hypothetical protein
MAVFLYFYEVGGIEAAPDVPYFPQEPVPASGARDAFP